MKKMLFIVVFTFLVTILFGQETNRQAANRANNFNNEWNSLVNMEKNLSGESFIRLKNYMMGFAEGAYRLCEDLQNSGYYNFSNYINFFFRQYQGLVGVVGARTIYFRNYYYNAGVDRAWWGSSRLGINDFR